MKIHCCSCHKVLNDDDVVVISIINGISHYTCVLIPSKDPGGWYISVHKTEV